MDENKIASVLESLCERPFAQGPQAPSASVRGAAPAQPPHLNPAPHGAADNARRRAGVGEGSAGGDAAMAPGGLAAILSGTATPTQVEAFHQVAAESDALRLEAQSALAFVDGIEQAPLAAPAFLVRQAVPTEPTVPLPSLPRKRGRVRVGAAAPKPRIWSRILPRRQVAAACAMLLMAGGVTWSLIGRNLEAPREEASPAPAAAPPAARDLDAIMRSRTPEQVPMVAPAPRADQAPLALPPPAATAPAATAAPDAPAAPAAAFALPAAKALADPCLPGAPDFGTPREATSPAVSQLGEGAKPPAGRMKAAAGAADEPGCPADEGRTLMGSTAVAPDAPEATEEPHDQRSDKARANRAASRKAAADRARPSAAAPAATAPAAAPLHRAPQPALVPSLPERAR